MKAKALPKTPKEMTIEPIGYNGNRFVAFIDVDGEVFCMREKEIRRVRLENQNRAYIETYTKYEGFLVYEIEAQKLIDDLLHPPLILRATEPAIVPTNQVGEIEELSK